MTPVSTQTIWTLCGGLPGRGSSSAPAPTSLNKQEKQNIFRVLSFKNKIRPADFERSTRHSLPRCFTTGHGPVGAGCSAGSALFACQAPFCSTPSSSRTLPDPRALSPSPDGTQNYFALILSAGIVWDLIRFLQIPALPHSPNICDSSANSACRNRRHRTSY